MIFRMTNPFKVSNVVVVLYPINVIHSTETFRIFNEVFSDKSVTLKCFSLTPVLHGNIQVAVFVFNCAEDMGNYTNFRTRNNPSDSSIRRNFVSSLKST